MSFDISFLHPSEFDNAAADLKSMFIDSQFYFERFQISRVGSILFCQEDSFMKVFLCLPLTLKHLCCGGILCYVGRAQMLSENIKVYCLLCRSIYNVQPEIQLIDRLKSKLRYLSADITQMHLL